MNYSILAALVLLTFCQNSKAGNVNPFEQFDSFNSLPSDRAQGRTDPIVKCKFLMGNESEPTLRNIFDISPRQVELTATGIRANMPDGTTLSRLRHLVNGVEVWDSSATAIESAKLRGLCSPGPSKIRESKPIVLRSMEIQSLEDSQRQAWNKLDSQNICFWDWGVDSFDTVTSITTARYVYRLEDETMTYADKVEIKGVDGRRNTIFRVFCLVDAVDRRIIKSWNGLEFYFGSGGNVKIGRHFYGREIPRLPAIADGNTCKMKNPNGTIEVFDLNKKGLPISRNATPYAYVCHLGAKDEINEGYSPLNDCFFTADQISKFLQDPAWGFPTELKAILPLGKIKVGAHYGNKVDNAYWDGDAVYMGNGDRTFYPLCTCQDIIAHEVGHAVTQMTSQLAYYGESGCISEAFSDMMGEAFENFASKEARNDFKIGADCVKPPRNYLRDMKHPTSYRFYRSSHTLHVCSGIFNYAFYRLANSDGWNTQLAFRAFALANTFLWKQKTGMKQAACDVVTAAARAKLGKLSAIVNAFDRAGIDVEHCLPTGYGLNSTATTPTTTTSTTTTTTTTTTTPTTTTTTTMPMSSVSTRRTRPPRTSSTTSTTTTTTTTSEPPVQTTIEPDPLVVSIENCESVFAISGETGKMFYFKVEAPVLATRINAYMEGFNGDADIYVSAGKIPTLDDYDWRPFFKGSIEWVRRQIMKVGTYYVMIHAFEAFDDLKFNACFY